METKQLLATLIEDLANIEERFSDLVDQSEFAGKREMYFKYGQEMLEIKEQLIKEYDNVADYATYTGILDEI